MNLASRLESASRLYGVPMLIGEATAAAVGRPLVELDRIAVKGRADGAAVFTVVGEGGAPAAQSAFLAAYRAGRWDEADEALGTLSAQEPGLGAYAGRMAERIRMFRETPPTGDWRGVFTASQK